ncbi:ribonuclease HII [Pseudoclavibacter helvolus]|uniref:Ribonuclease n=1 Tax=Pseudoclavibacter helvolus TaxID=255205 RepID=A0A7W4YG62_9MICO|nr:ribonuclease HII [Pseudoclavibacter helvolus]
MTPPVDPTLDVERELLLTAPVVIGVDEVGRGAIAGPVAVGACAIDARRVELGAPSGVRDSKLLSAKRRLEAREGIESWAMGVGVGYASASEIDERGITACLGAAAKRALAELHASGVPVADAVVLLDGSHDWLSPCLSTPLRVVVRPKADRDCTSVAAASVVAKLERDALMISAAEAHPEYLWESNKGYGSAAHLAAIAATGPSELHRHTWLRAATP